MPDLQIPSTEHYQEAIDSVRKRVPVPRDVWDDMQADEREHAFTVSQVARTQVLQQVLDAIDDAVTNGTAIDDFRDDVADSLIDQWGGEIPSRIETIFRTGVATAYAEGRHAINDAPAVREARPFLRYDDTDNDRECEICHDCHGVILPADDPWWETHHPPMHHQCECTVTALSPEEAEEEGLTSSDDIPDVEADDGFGNQPSSEGSDWAPDLTDIDPELRAALEERLREMAA
jgi:SPP1 gp7 family putative phage head morphogenesis protein